MWIASGMRRDRFARQPNANHEFGTGCMGLATGTYDPGASAGPGISVLPINIVA